MKLVAITLFFLAFVGTRILGVGVEDSPPSWLRGAFKSEDETLEVQFISRGKVWFTANGVYESLMWNCENNRYWVIRKIGKESVRVGYAVQGKEEFCIEWHAIDPRKPTLVLKQASRLDEPKKGPNQPVETTTARAAVVRTPLHLAPPISPSLAVASHF